MFYKGPYILTFSILILSLFLSPLPSFSREVFHDKEIKEVSFEGIGKDIPIKELRYLVTFREGDLYSFADIKKSIKNLYLKGIFSQVSAEAIKKDDGLVIFFHLQQKPMVASLKVKGNKALDDDELLPHIPLKKGGDLSDEGIKKSEEKLREIYHNNGHYRAEVTTELEGKETESKVTFIISEHRACLLEKVSFAGLSVFKEDNLRALLKSELEEPVKIAFLEEDRKRLFDFYKRSGYLHVQVSEPVISFDERKGRAKITFHISAGPRTVFGIKDKLFFTNEEIIKIIDPDLGDTINEPRLKKWEERIINAYQDNGFTAVQVNAKLIPSENENLINFTIDEGQRYFIGSITVKGNKVLERNEITALFKPVTALTTPPFSMKKLEESIETVTEIYKSRGLLDARIKNNLIFHRDKGTTDIELNIVEGVQALIKDIRFSGAYSLNEATLKDHIGLRSGNAINMDDVEKGAAIISRLYGAEGYIYVEVEKDISFSDDKREAALHFRISEGPQVKMGKVIIRGNRQTKNRVIMRELSLSEGDIYNVDKIAEDRLNIYKTGLFKRVRYEERPGYPREQTRDMLLTVDERKAGAIEIGMGYATDVGLRAFAEVSYLNIAGTGRSARLRGSVSKIRNNIFLGYKEPWLLGFPVDGRVELMHQSHERESYDIEKDGITLSIDKQLSREIRLSLQYRFEKSDYSNVEAGTAQEEGRSTIGSIGPVIVRDSRDDPFDPGEGSVNLLHFEVADEALSSDDEFHKTTAQSSWYRKLTDRFVAALSIRAGYIDLRGNTQDVPADKRFYLGGRTTVRGYKEDSIGPENAFGSPIGGEKMLNINIEARIKLMGDFGGLLFWDGGNVWQTGDKSDLSDLRKAYGGGLRYLTPIGPLSLEYGRKLDRQTGESKGEWYFTIGNIF